ncbi:hypothetical protein TRVA0_013S01156 [Trichomonascus vanleenenianus]|uniref:MFS transporter n=1 Tax=Trichomonascus vanleenenianus TaxID=2268995 RepID=UPI003ECADF00
MPRPLHTLCDPALIMAHTNQDDPTRVVAERNEDHDLIDETKKGEVIVRAVVQDQPLTTKWEIIGYMLYYVGNNSVGPYSYTPIAFQNLVSEATFDPTKRPYGKVACTADTVRCVVKFGGVERTVSSVVLLSQGIGFVLQSVVFLFLGAFADYGSWGPYILIGLSILSWGVQFGFLGVHDPSKWQAAFGLSVLSSLGYQGCQSFWTAVFPRLARFLPSVKEKEDQLLNGEITEAEYHKVDSYHRNRITNWAWAVSNIGMVVTNAVAVGILYALHSRESVTANTWGISVVIAWATALWIVLGVPWFFLEQKRVNQPLPSGQSYWTIGFKQIAYVFRSVLKLKQTGLYIFTYWLLGDGLNTASNLVGIVQNDIVSYDMVTLAYVNILNSGLSIVGMGVFWYIQKKFGLSTKVMFLANAIFITILPLYGMVGMWTGKAGIHNKWEVWLYNAYSGLLISPYYAYSSTMMSEVCPRGKEFIFFSIFSVVNKTSSWIGPFITSAITNKTNNNWSGFPFVFALCAVSVICTFFIDLKKARIECEEFLISEAERVNAGEDVTF